MNRLAVAAAVAVVATLLLTWFALRSGCRLPIEEYEQHRDLQPAESLRDELERARLLCTGRAAVSMTRDDEFVWSSSPSRFGGYRAAYRIEDGALVYVSTGAGDVIDFSWHACGGELRYGTRPGPIPAGMSNACSAIAQLASSLTVAF